MNGGLTGLERHEGSGKMKGIIPKSKAKGTDICATDYYKYIIRSDLGCYMQTSNINQGSDISIFNLHPACKNGDHYLGDWGSRFYIIKGKFYRRVTDLMTDSDAVVYSLHPNCQGGDHYFSDSGCFYIIFQEKGTLRKTTNMNQDTDAQEIPLPPNWRNILYFWAVQDHFNFLKASSEWGVEFCCAFSYKDNCADVYSVHPDVLNFLPGGLSVTKGPAIGIWENIKNIKNDSKTLMIWEKNITKKVGYNKEKMTQITHNWKIGASATIESGELAKLIAKFQLSFSAEYGGSHVSTEKENWDEMTEVVEKIKFELKPDEHVYLWQYKLCLGEEPVLFCRDLTADDEPNPPTQVPLPPAQP
uniref:Uncharacterized protein n=2 Tax=Cyprinus carpio carpio TaxID=630221 RepID=A0A8C1E641_CYPCA